MKKVSVNDSFQKGYTYIITEPEGKRFHPEFKPELTPKQMLELGVFGGGYFADKPKEFPKEWFAKAKLSKEENSDLNLFKVKASLPWEEWKRRGWLSIYDPRGWFQWYCRYYLGRRIPAEDERQIKRWKAIRRHIAQLKKHCKPGDFGCRRKQRQALLHWAIDSRKL